MSFTATIYRVFIGSPSDVQAERDAAERAVRRWNSLHAEVSRVALLPVRWELDGIAEQGEGAQELLNSRLGDRCDLLVGIFWHRVGTKTKVADSGTIEEIERFLAAKKPVSLFHSRKDIPQSDLDPKQLGNLKKALEGYKKGGIVKAFASPAELENFVYDALVHRIQEIHQRRETSMSEEQQPQPSTVASTQLDTRRNLVIKVNFAMAFGPFGSVDVVAIDIYNDGPRRATIHNVALKLTDGRCIVQPSTRHVPAPNLPRSINEGEKIQIMIESDPEMLNHLRLARQADPKFKIAGAVVCDAASNEYFGEAHDNVTINLLGGT